MNADDNVVASAVSGSIYDLGYRHYEGRRYGRLWATWSLYVESMRGIFGFGRPTSAKAAPFVLAGLYALPAVIVLAFSSIISRSLSTGQTSLNDLPNYANYFGGMGIFIVLFLIAQAPEVVCRDQRYQVLPLYFTRAMGRVDYAIAKLASLTTAVFLVLVVPVVVLFVGDILRSTDTFKAIGDEWPKALPSIPADLLVAVSVSSIALALSSYSPRRAYAAIGVLAYFLLMEVVPVVIYGVGHDAGSTWVDNLLLLTPSSALYRASDWFFGVPTPPDFPASLGTDAYVWASLASVLLFTGMLLFRYRRVAA